MATVGCHGGFRRVEVPMVGISLLEDEFPIPRAIRVLGDILPFAPKLRICFVFQATSKNLGLPGICCCQVRPKGWGVILHGLHLMLKCKIGALSTFAAQALQASIALAMSSCWVPLRTSLSRSMVLSASSNLSPCISTGYANRWQMSTLMCTSENVQKVFHPQAFRHVLKAWLPSLAAMSVEAY